MARKWTQADVNGKLRRYIQIENLFWGVVPYPLCRHVLVGLSEIWYCSHHGLTYESHRRNLHSREWVRTEQKL